MACCHKPHPRTWKFSPVCFPGQSHLDMARTAVVLMNLGGPDRLEDVQPFLFNLFSDPAIIRLPAFSPCPWAGVFSGRRPRVARSIYSRFGGGSPLLTNPEAQARALELML